MNKFCKKVKFLTIFSTFGKLEIVKKTLPSILEDTKKNNAGLIVFDSTDNNEKKAKWNYLESLNENKDFFLMLSTNLSLGHARNTCLHLGQELFLPDYICIIDDDHGFRPGMIRSLISTMDKYYGKIAPNGLKFGLFTGCNIHRVQKHHVLPDGHSYPDKNCKIGPLGGTNGCFRCAPTSHWNNVLKGYDLDEYLISYYQTKNISTRNYFRGFTTLVVDSGNKSFYIHSGGRGASNKGQRLWDDQYTASDERAKYCKK